MRVFKDLDMVEYLGSGMPRHFPLPGTPQQPDRRASYPHFQ
jgi:hypothetical protein